LSADPGIQVQIVDELSLAGCIDTIPAASFEDGVVHL
jgi:hypothetical protein